GVDIDGDAVKAHPASETDADRCDLVLCGGAVRQRRPVWAYDPDADAILAPLGADVHARKGADDPVLERQYERTHVFAPALEVEHDVGHPLSGPMIGVFAAAAGGEYRKSIWLKQVGRPGAGAGRIERRMLDQPHLFA